MESTKDLERDKELIAEEDLENEEQLEPEDELVGEKDYEKDDILTSLVLIHDHQLSMCLICTFFPLSNFVPMGFLDKVFNEANDSHSNHLFVDQHHGITFRTWLQGIYIKSKSILCPLQAQEEPKPSG